MIFKAYVFNAKCGLMILRPHDNIKYNFAIRKSVLDDLSHYIICYINYIFFYIIIYFLLLFYIFYKIFL